MEMISYETLTYALFAVIGVIWSIQGIKWLDRRLRKEVHEERIRNLKSEQVRNELSGFLRKQMVVGDADIRQGIVFAPVPPDRLDPLAVTLGNAAATMSRLSNLAADVLYVRRMDGSTAMIGLDLDHIIDAARVMQRVAEDRRKSRSIYKGLTDEEMLSLARAGLSQWYKDRGDFDYSNKVMAGDFDDDRVIQQAIYILDLTFKVKGASNV